MILTSTLATLPDERTALDPTAACIDDDRLALTNAEFLARVKAEDLRRRALRGWAGPGDPIATTLTNCCRAGGRHAGCLADRSRSDVDQTEPTVGEAVFFEIEVLRRSPGRR